jgi:hypothetical protein
MSLPQQQHLTFGAIFIPFIVARRKANAGRWEMFDTRHK